MGEHIVAYALRPVIALTGRPIRKIRPRLYTYGNERHRIETTRSGDTAPCQLLVRTNQQQAFHIAVDRQFAAQMQHGESLLVAVDVEACDALQWDAFVGSSQVSV